MKPLTHNPDIYIRLNYNKIDFPLFDLYIYFMYIIERKKDSLFSGRHYTVCPGSSDPFYIASLLYKMGHYFLDI